MFYEELFYRTKDGEPRTLTDEKTGFNWNEEHEDVKSHMHVSLINEMRCNTYRHALQTLLVSTFLPMFLFFVNIRTYYECNPNYYNQPKDVPISGLTIISPLPYFVITFSFSIRLQNYLFCNRYVNILVNVKENLNKTMYARGD